MGKFILVADDETQVLGEIRTWYFDFNPDLPAGVTVTGGTATHTPPSGAASTPTVGAPSGGTVAVTLPAQTVRGTHYLKCTATLSDGQTSTIELGIPVWF